MPDHYWRHVLLRPRQENGGAGDTRNLIFFDLLHEFANRHDRLMETFGNGCHADVPHYHDEVDAGCKHEWNVSTLGDLGEIGDEEGCIDDKKPTGDCS